jgi:dihydropteroate synthase
MKLAWNGNILDFSEKICIMGVLNVTPDSFSDGGLHFDRDKAVEHSLRLIDDGADIIDVGGESTRPGSMEVALDEELRRTIPVIEALASKISVPISIDTYKSEVAKRALEAGASIVNDISGLRFDAKMAQVVASYGVPVIIKGTPKDMQKNPCYEALIPEIMDYLRLSIDIASRAGIDGQKIIIDPGIGFGKTFDDNLHIIKHLDEFTSLQKPIAIGVSRKAFIGKILNGAPPEERLEGTAAAVAIAIMNGADIVRVHDVKQMSRVAKVARTIKNGNTTSIQESQF